MATIATIEAYIADFAGTQAFEVSMNGRECGVITLDKSLGCYRVFYNANKGSARKFANVQDAAGHLIDRKIAAAAKARAQ